MLRIAAAAAATLVVIVGRHCSGVLVWSGQIVGDVGIPAMSDRNVERRLCRYIRP